MKVWVRAHVHIDPPRFGGVKVMVEDTKISHWSMEVHTENSHSAEELEADWIIALEPAGAAACAPLASATACP